MSQINYYTVEGLQKLKDELHELKTVQRPSISEQIAEARDKGDLSENAEYDAAKEAQGILEMKISKLENIIANARLIDETLLPWQGVVVHQQCCKQQGQMPNGKLEGLTSQSIAVVAPQLEGQLSKPGAQHHG